MIDRTLRVEPSAEAHPEAAALLAAAGWTPHPKWGVFTRGTLVMGGDHLGGFHVKDWGMDIHGPDTPDTAEEAAAWLVQRFAIPADVVTLDYAPEPEQTPRSYDEATAEYFAEYELDHANTGEDRSSNAPPTFTEDSADAFAGEGASSYGEGAGSGERSDYQGAELDDGDREAAALSEPQSEGADRSHDVEEVDETHGETGEEADGAALDEGGDQAGVGDSGAAGDSGLVGSDADVQPLPPEPIDADFEPIPDLPEIELIPPDPNPDFGAELLEFEGELTEPDEPAGPIAYAASDFDALIREKTGRVSQIARGLKAELQEGWTLDEYASLQNQIVMMDRGQMPDDPAARERFVSISQMSQAMSRVDAVRDAKEAALEDIGQRRNYADATAFDPESDWP